MLQRTQFPSHLIEDQYKSIKNYIISSYEILRLSKDVDKKIRELAAYLLQVDHWEKAIIASDNYLKQVEEKIHLAEKELKKKLKHSAKESKKNPQLIASKLTVDIDTLTTQVDTLKSELKNGCLRYQEYLEADMAFAQVKNELVELVKFTNEITPEQDANQFALAEDLYERYKQQRKNLPKKARVRCLLEIISICEDIHSDIGQDIQGFIAHVKEKLYKQVSLALTAFLKREPCSKDLRDKENELRAIVEDSNILQVLLNKIKTYELESDAMLVLFLQTKPSLSELREKREALATIEDSESRSMLLEMLAVHMQKNANIQQEIRAEKQAQVDASRAAETMESIAGKFECNEEVITQKAAKKVPEKFTPADMLFLKIEQLYANPNLTREQLEEIQKLCLAAIQRKDQEGEEQIAELKAVEPLDTTMQFFTREYEGLRERFAGRWQSDTGHLFYDTHREPFTLFNQRKAACDQRQKSIQKATQDNDYFYNRVQEIYSDVQKRLALPMTNRP